MICLAWSGLAFAICWVSGSAAVLQLACSCFSWPPAARPAAAIAASVGISSCDISSSVLGWKFSAMISAAMRVMSRAMRTISSLRSLIRTEPYWLLSCWAPSVSLASVCPRMMSDRPVICRRRHQLLAQRDQLLDRRGDLVDRQPDDHVLDAAVADHRPVGDPDQDLIVVVDLIAASIASPISPAPAG
jgi:hypothetical protein